MTDLRYLSHELRGPLAGVLGLVDNLVQTMTSDEQRRKLHAVSSAAVDMIAIVERCLGSGIDASASSDEEMQFAPVTLIEDIVALAGPVAAAKGLTLALHYDGSLPAQLRGNRSMVREIVTNLLTNAIKFTDLGTVTLVTSGRQSDGQCRWQVTVEDQGPGIPASACEDIFLEAFRLEATRSLEGEGLGLAISRQLARNMGGEIVVASVEGAGSVFTFSVEMACGDQHGPEGAGTATATTSSDSVAALQASAARMRVLVVDDSNTNRIILANMLCSLPVDVTMAASGVEALAVLRAQQQDLVLMDLNMPELDGFATTAAIRRLERSCGEARTPIVAVTANAVRGERDRCVAADMDDYVSKPIRQARIRATIEAWNGVKQNPDRRPDTKYNGPERRKSVCKPSCDGDVRRPQISIESTKFDESFVV